MAPTPIAKSGHTETPKLVYLDMNIWVALTRGCIQRDSRWQAARDGLILAVENGRAMVPLSSAHYLELWHRSNEESREHVGTLMRDISQYATIQPSGRVRAMEVEAHISRLQLSTTYANHDSRNAILGHGVAHAFGSPHGRFRFVESRASADDKEPEGPPTAPPEGWEQLDRQGDAWEWLHLVGTQRLLELNGLDRTPEHRHGSSYLRDQIHLREQATNNPEIHRRLRDIVAGEELMSLIDDINEIAEQLRIDPRSLIFSEPTMSPPESIHNFVSNLPSADTWATLRYWKHRDLTHPWDQHDWTDLSALSIAVPYCDFVLTERRWAHMIKASGLAEKYSTSVGHSLSAIEGLLEELS